MKNRSLLLFCLVALICSGCSSSVGDCDLSHEVETEKAWYLDSSVYKSSHGLDLPKIIGVYEFIPVEREPKIDSNIVQKRIEQFYPEELRRKKIVGKVLVRALFDPQGIIKAAVIEVTYCNSFNKPTLDVVRGLQGIPATQNHQPIWCWMSFWVKFGVQ